MGSSAEARVVKDLDKFDMILQAYEYEQGIVEPCRSGKDRHLCIRVCIVDSRTGALQEFFDSTDGIILQILCCSAN